MQLVHAICLAGITAVPVLALAKADGDITGPYDVDEGWPTDVCDHANSGIQIFDADGNYLDQWNDITCPYDIHVSRDQQLWVSDGWTNKMLNYDLDGELLYSWGTFGKLPGAFRGPHQFSADAEGNLYIADVHVGRVQKVRPKTDADPGLLVGPKPWCERTPARTRRVLHSSVN